MKNNSFNQKQRKTFGVVLSVVALFVLAYGYRCGLQKVCGSSLVEKVVRNGKEITLPQGKVHAEVANTPASRAQGLSGRSGLSSDEGMLFVFDHSGKYGFWMKDMLFSIDIVWINEDGVVVHVVHNATPASYFVTNPPQTFMNTPDARYVLELASGQAEKFGLYLGTKVKIGE
jgi:uncharacterized membrane protein (UPF0127 family)